MLDPKIQAAVDASSLQRVTRKCVRVLAHVMLHPGCNASDIVRWCFPANVRTGYMFTQRLLRAGALVHGAPRPESARGGARGLYLACDIPLTL